MVTPRQRQLQSPPLKSSRLDIGTVADPGFPIRGDANPKWGGGGLPINYLVKCLPNFAENCMKLKLDLEGARVPSAPFGSSNEESSPLKSSRQSLAGNI